MCSNDVEGSQSSLGEFYKEINSEMTYVWQVSSKRLRINFPQPFGNSEQQILLILHMCDNYSYIEDNFWRCRQKIGRDLATKSIYCVSEIKLIIFHHITI